MRHINTVELITNFLCVIRKQSSTSGAFSTDSHPSLYYLLLLPQRLSTIYLGKVHCSGQLVSLCPRTRSYKDLPAARVTQLFLPSQTKNPPSDIPATLPRRRTSRQLHPTPAIPTHNYQPDPVMIHRSVPPLTAPYSSRLFSGLLTMPNSPVRRRCMLWAIAGPLYPSVLSRVLPHGKSKKQPRED